MASLRAKLSYYFGATYRRKILDRLLEENKDYYQGTVLDIGGRERGKFKKPKEKVKKWIFADIEKRHKPDIILDVSNMTSIEDESVDVINAIELFEHVESPEKVLAEAKRVGKHGVFLFSTAANSFFKMDPSHKIVKLPYTTLATGDGCIMF